MPVSRRKDPEFERCRFCGGLLPEVRRSDMQFCPKGYTPPDLGISRPYPGPNQTCKDAFHNAENGRLQSRRVMSTEPVSGPNGADLGDRTVIAKGELHREASITDVMGRAMRDGFDPLATVAEEGGASTGLDADEMTITDRGGESAGFAGGGRADPTGSYETYDPTKRGPARYFRPGRRGKAYSVRALLSNVTREELLTAFDALSLDEQLQLVAESADIRRIVNLELANALRRVS